MFAFAIQAGHQYGMGHLYRALHLAEYMLAKGHRCIFFLNEDRVSAGILSEKNIPYHVIDYDAAHDWEKSLVQQYQIEIWLNDRLATDLNHVKRIKAQGVHVVTFDDYGQGASLSDVHFAGLPLADAVSLLGQRVFSGIDYLILNPEIKQFRRQRVVCEHVIVSLGGSDTHGVTIDVISYLNEISLNATIILGPNFVHDQELEKIVTEDFTVKRHVDSLAAEFCQHDLAITGGGITALEASAAGLPCIIIANEEWEVKTAQYLEAMGTAIFAGHYQGIDFAKINNTHSVADMSRIGLKHFDVNGIENIYQVLMQL